MLQCWPHFADINEMSEKNVFYTGEFVYVLYFVYITVLVYKHLSQQYIIFVIDWPWNTGPWTIFPSSNQRHQQQYYFNCCQQDPWPQTCDSRFQQVDHIWQVSSQTEFANPWPDWCQQFACQRCTCKYVLLVRIKFNAFFIFLIGIVTQYNECVLQVKKLVIILLFCNTQEVQTWNVSTYVVWYDITISTRYHSVS